MICKHCKKETSEEPLIGLLRHIRKRLASMINRHNRVGENSKLNNAIAKWKDWEASLVKLIQEGSLIEGIK